MPRKDLIARAEYSRAQYLRLSAGVRLAQQEKSKLRRRELATEKKRLKALESVVVVQRFCQDCGVDITAVYRAKHGGHCKACIAAYQKVYRGSNLERIAESKKNWKLSNPEHVAEQDRKYAAAHPEKRVVARRKWSAANPGKDTACKTQTRLARIKRTPVWLSEDDKWLIEQAYELAAMRTRMLGFVWHVDHILPLTGRKVSGLHVPTNLQVIPGAENSRKHNRYEVA